MTLVRPVPASTCRLYRVRNVNMTEHILLASRLKANLGITYYDSLITNLMFEPSSYKWQRLSDGHLDHSLVQCDSKISWDFSIHSPACMEMGPLASWNSKTILPSSVCCGELYYMPDTAFRIQASEIYFSIEDIWWPCYRLTSWAKLFVFWACRMASSAKWRATFVGFFRCGESDDIAYFDRLGWHTTSYILHFMPHQSLFKTVVPLARRSEWIIIFYGDRPPCGSNWGSGGKACSFVHIAQWDHTNPVLDFYQELPCMKLVPASAIPT